jgi:hypothetical protein
MHENFAVSDEISDITDYIIYFTQEKLNELKKISPRVDIDNISIKFSTRYGSTLGSYNSKNREFKHNLNWITEHMVHPDFKTELDNHIIHEVAHVAYQDHSRYWKLICRHLGHPDPERTYGNKQFFSKAKYILRCPICGKTYNMYGKPRKEYRCKICRYSHGSDATLISEKQYRTIKLRKMKDKVKKAIKK